MNINMVSDGCVSGCTPASAADRAYRVTRAAPDWMDGMPSSGSEIGDVHALPVRTMPWPAPAYYPRPSFPTESDNLSGIFDAIADLLRSIGTLISRLFGGNRPQPLPMPLQGQANGFAPYNDSGVASASFKGAFDPSRSGFSKKAPSGPLSQKERDKLAATAMTRLMKDLKLTPAQAAGIVGNLKQESGMQPNINEIGSGGRAVGAPNSSGAGYGWAQWTGARKTAYLNYARAHKLDPGSPAANYGFLVHELKTSERASLAALKKAKTAADAALVFRVKFERAGIPNDNGRMNAAASLLAAYQKSVSAKSVTA